MTGAPAWTRNSPTRSLMCRSTGSGWKSPRSVAASGQLKILMDGKPLATAEPVERPGSANPVRRQVILPALRIGRCEVAVSYSVELDKLLPAASIPATIPLVMPAEGELAGNRVVVNPKEGIRVQARGGPWTTDAGVAPAGDAAWKSVDRRRARELTLRSTLKTRTYWAPR